MLIKMSKQSRITHHVNIFIFNGLQRRVKIVKLLLNIYTGDKGSRKKIVKKRNIINSPNHSDYYLTILRDTVYG